jgi:hypothetical protein
MSSHKHTGVATSKSSHAPGQTYKQPDRLAQIDTASHVCAECGKPFTAAYAYRYHLCFRHNLEEIAPKKKGGKVRLVIVSEETANKFRQRQMQDTERHAKKRRQLTKARADQESDDEKGEPRNDEGDMEGESTEEDTDASDSADDRLSSMTSSTPRQDTNTYASDKRQHTPKHTQTNLTHKPHQSALDTEFPIGHRHHNSQKSPLPLAGVPNVPSLHAFQPITPPTHGAVDFNMFQQAHTAAITSAPHFSPNCYATFQTPQNWDNQSGPNPSCSTSYATQHQGDTSDVHGLFENILQNPPTTTPDHTMYSQTLPESPSYKLLQWALANQHPWLARTMIPQAVKLFPAYSAIGIGTRCATICETAKLVATELRSGRYPGNYNQKNKHVQMHLIGMRASSMLSQCNGWYNELHWAQHDSQQTPTPLSATYVSLENIDNTVIKLWRQGTPFEVATPVVTLLEWYPFMAPDEAVDLSKLILDTIREVAQILLSSGCPKPDESHHGMYEAPCDILLEITKRRGIF